MTTPAVLETIKDPEAPPVGLEAAIALDLAEIVEADERTGMQVEGGVAAWYYWIVCHGVRYYSYWEWPSPVER